MKRLFILALVLLAPVPAYADASGYDFSPLVNSLINVVGLGISGAILAVIGMLFAYLRKKYHWADALLTAQAQQTITNLVQSGVDDAVAMGQQKATAYVAAHPVQVDTGSVIGNVAMSVVADHATPALVKKVTPQVISNAIERAVAKATAQPAPTDAQAPVTGAPTGLVPEAKTSEAPGSAA